MNIKELEQFLNSLLKPETYDDYCPNGLQIEGKNQIKKIIFSVSATAESAQYAADKGACALLVHHGVFWKFHGPRTLTGTFGRRLFPLIRNEINLLAYHLPLDGHIEIGNAAAIAKMLGLNDLECFGNYKGATTGIKGRLPNSVKANVLKETLKSRLGHEVLYSNPPENKGEITTIGIITGGANSEWREALKSGLDAYITGEMSEHDYHESREAGIHMFACGHHATEKHGIIALMELIKTQFPDLDCEFLDSENPA